MPKGREICDYALRVRSTNRMAGPAGSTILSISLAGDATNVKGNVIATATMDASLDRPIELRTVTLHDDGSVVSRTGRGFCRETGDGRFATKVFMYSGNTPVSYQEGVFDQATSTWSTKEFEWILGDTPSVAAVGQRHGLGSIRQAA